MFFSLFIPTNQPFGIYKNEYDRNRMVNRSLLASFVILRDLARYLELPADQ